MSGLSRLEHVEPRAFEANAKPSALHRLAQRIKNFLIAVWQGIKAFCTCSCMRPIKVSRPIEDKKGAVTNEIPEQPKVEPVVVVDKSQLGKELFLEHLRQIDALIQEDRKKWFYESSGLFKEAFDNLKNSGLQNEEYLKGLLLLLTRLPRHSSYENNEIISCITIGIHSTTREARGILKILVFAIDNREQLDSLQRMLESSMPDIYEGNCWLKGSCKKGAYCNFQNYMIKSRIDSLLGDLKVDPNLLRDERLYDGEENRGRTSVYHKQGIYETGIDLRPLLSYQGMGD